MSSTALRTHGTTAPLGASCRRSRPVPDARRRPVLPALVGVFASAAVIFGATALLLYRTGRGSAVGPGWASIILTTGLMGLLFHAAFDRDIQFRRAYMAFGYLALGIGAFLCILPYPIRPADQFGPGYLCMSLGLLFLLCFLRHETDEKVRDFAFYVFGGAGGIMALFGLFGGLIRPDVLLGNKDTFVSTPVGLLLAMLGLVFLIACVHIRGTSDETSYRIGQAIGIAGGIVFLVALLASFFPSALWFTKRYPGYFMPFGLLLQILGLLYVATCLFICSDRPIIVLTRRELGAFFYSPIAHLVLLSFVVAHWFGYLLFTVELWNSRVPLPEPIVSGFILQFSSIFWTLFGVPALTMRLLSEEHRSHTLEQLLTVPVEEGTVVLSKFFAAFIMFVITWLPFGFLMVSLRLEGGREFDYRPLFSFGVGLFLTGSAFISIGLFFSSLTSNQIIAGVMTFGAMLTLTLVLWAKRILANDQLLGPDSGWIAVMKHVSYIDVWIDSLDGKLVPKFLLFPVSTTVLCLFLSVKVLESRKWR